MLKRKIMSAFLKAYGDVFPNVNLKRKYQLKKRLTGIQKN